MKWFRVGIAPSHLYTANTDKKLLGNTFLMLFQRKPFPQWEVDSEKILSAIFQRNSGFHISVMDP